MNENRIVNRAGRVEGLRQPYEYTSYQQQVRAALEKNIDNLGKCKTTVPTQKRTALVQEARRALAMPGPAALVAFCQRRANQNILAVLPSSIPPRSQSRADLNRYVEKLKKSL